MLVLICQQTSDTKKMSNFPQDELRRKTKGYLPECDVAFIDEIFKVPRDVGDGTGDLIENDQLSPGWKWENTTPPKFNSEVSPEKRWLEDDPFLLEWYIFRGYVKFPGCTMGDFFTIVFYMFFFSKVDLYLFVNPVGTGIQSSYSGGFCNKTAWICLRWFVSK